MSTMVQRCGKCGQEWLQAHFCPALHTPRHDGAKPAQPLTEADVRRIVRDELQAAACWCSACKPLEYRMTHMIVCPQCGDKRCPRADDHRNECRVTPNAKLNGGP